VPLVQRPCLKSGEGVASDSTVTVTEESGVAVTVACEVGEDVGRGVEVTVGDGGGAKGVVEVMAGVGVAVGLVAVFRMAAGVADGDGMAEPPQVARMSASNPGNSIRTARLNFEGYLRQRNGLTSSLRWL